MARALGIVGLFIPWLLYAQTPPPSFTVASIKPNKSTDDRFMLRPMPGGGLTATGVTLKMLIMNAYEFDAPVERLISQLAQQLDRPVLDKTGLSGNYDFKLEWSPAPGEGGLEAFGLPPRADPPRPSASNGPSIFTALEEQLGLKLKSTKAPVDILVIDHVKRASEN